MSRCEQVKDNLFSCDADYDPRDAFRLAAKEGTNEAYSPKQAIRVGASAIIDAYSTIDRYWQEGLDTIEEGVKSDWPWYFYPFKPHAYLGVSMLNGQKTIITKCATIVTGPAMLAVNFIDNVEMAAKLYLPNPIKTGAIRTGRDVAEGTYLHFKDTVINFFNIPFDLADGEIGKASQNLHGAIFDVGMIVLGITRIFKLGKSKAFHKAPTEPIRVSRDATTEPAQVSGTARTETAPAPKPARPQTFLDKLRKVHALRKAKKEAAKTAPEATLRDLLREIQETPDVGKIGKVARLAQKCKREPDLLKALIEKAKIDDLAAKSLAEITTRYNVKIQ